MRNVRQYDPYRSREHIERTVKYNMLERADGKYVSKCDSNPRRLGIVRGTGPLENITLDDARGVRPAGAAGARRELQHPDGGRGGTVSRCVAARELVTVPDCGHNVHGQNTKGFIAAVGGFLDAHA